ncbi:Protein FAR1-RELATED SEQUENCE 5, partial [Frankliniella fusca]
MFVIGEEFDSFDEFKKKLAEYEDKVFAVYTIASSSTIANANKKLLEKDGGAGNLYKPELKYQNVKFTCTSGGRCRVGTGTGARPMQSTNKIGCPSLLHLISTRTKLVVEKLVEEHNHECSQETYLSLPEKSRLSQEHTEKVKLLFKGGVKPAKVRALLRDYGAGRVDARYLSNLRQKWRNEETEHSPDEERLNVALQKLTDCDGSVIVGRDDVGEDTMKQNVIDFGLVLILDHTYKVNENRMPVCVMMVMDGNGAGRVAGYAFVVNEHLGTVSQVLKSFKECVGEEAANKIKTVVIDKDPSEIGAISLVLPNAQIQLCLFHLGKVLKERSSRESQELKDLVQELKYAEGENFNALVQRIKANASATFFKYLDDNWLSCPQAWANRDKRDSINLGNFTTNRVECHNSKIKMLLSYNTRLPDAVEGILHLAQNKEDDVFFRDMSESLKKTYKTTSLNDPLTMEILEDLTKFASRLLLWEIETLPSEEELLHYDSSSDSCGCRFRTSYGLPCRHIFQHRRLSGTNTGTEATVTGVQVQIINDQEQDQISNQEINLVPANNRNDL